MTNTFYEEAIESAPKQAVLIDKIVESSPILSNMPMMPTSDGLSNVYETVVDLVGADQVDLDAPLPTMTYDSNLTQVDLSVFGGKMVVPEDKAKKLGGAQAYFGKRLPKQMAETGNALEKSLYYNSLRKFSIDNGNYVKAGGSTADSQYSMVCVTWDDESITGLYDADGFGRGEVFDIKTINDGALYEIDSDGVLGYGVRAKLYTGLQLADERKVASIVNIDASNLPTEAEISQMIIDARGNSAQSKIYMHPTLKRMISTAYKIGKIQMANSDKGINTLVDVWDDVEIITSYNLLNGTEAVVA